MTHRERLLAVFNGKDVDPVPVSIRMEFWHQDALRKNALPHGLKDMTVQEVEAHLGFAQTARFRGFFRIEFEGACVGKVDDGDCCREEIRAGGRQLTRISRFNSEMKAAGMSSHVVKYPVETEKDYEFLIDLFQNARIVVDQESCSRFDSAVGDAGMPLLIIGPCPFHKIALEYVGYEKLFFHMYDMPEFPNRLTSAIDEVYRRDLWPEVAVSSAPAVLHGAHFSSDMTPPPLFDRYFRPYLSAFLEHMRPHGKFVGFHADAEMGALLKRVADLGFHFADCLATEPLIKTSLSEYYAAWHRKIAMWGGLPSIIFDPSYSFDKFREHVAEVLRVGRERGALIIGASDNVMPGAEWDRLLFLSEAISRGNH